MKKLLLVFAIMLACSSLTQNIFAADLVIKAGDTIQKLLVGYQGKQVTLRLNNSEEMTGKVLVVTKELVQLGELSGQEYYDGIIDINKISAVVVRVHK
jgi:hypothetical protein